MRRHRVYIFAFAAVVAALAASPRATPVDLLWPVALDPGISSSFCDYRDGRYHAGVDVRTYGREGIACLAVGDGYVSRVRASSRGYGKALHLTLDSGVQVVYAHLAEFTPAVEETLWSEQRKAGRYSVDVAIPPSRFRVRRGDVVAYSGSTGATAPHLHFEVRTLADEPLNPLTHGLLLPDRERPSIARVAFLPLSAEATVEGRCFPLEIEPRRVSDGRYRIDDTLRFSGDVGVAATVVDRVNRRSGRLTPHEMQVWSDGTQLTRVTFEQFSFDEVKHVDQAMDMGALRARGTDLYTLYQRAGDGRGRVEFIRGGRIAPAPSTRPVHEGRLVALDTAGNRAEVAFLYMDSVTVSSGAFRRPVAGARWRESHVAVDLGGAYIHDDFAVLLSRSDRHRLTERRHEDEHADIDTVVFHASDLIGTTRAFADARPSASDLPLTFSAIAAATAGVIRAEVEINYPADAVYADAVVFVSDEGEAGAGRQRSLKPRSRAFSLGPAGLVLKRNLSLRVPVEQPAAGDGIFRSGGNDGPWSYVATTLDSAGLSSAIDRPGVFAVFRDQAAPWLGTPKIVVATSYATGATSNEVHVPVDDEGSGFDETRTEVFVGGAKQIWRWDFMAKKIIVALHDDSIIGPQPVRVVAFDRLGNSSSTETTVVIEARPAR